MSLQNYSINDTIDYSVNDSINDNIYEINNLIDEIDELYSELRVVEDQYINSLHNTSHYYYNNKQIEKYTLDNIKEKMTYLKIMPYFSVFYNFFMEIMSYYK